MKFERKDWTLLGQPAVSYRLLDDTFQFNVIATSRGVRLNGSPPLFKTQDDLDELMRIMEWGLRHHRSIIGTGTPIPQEQLNLELSE